MVLAYHMTRLTYQFGVNVTQYCGRLWLRQGKGWSLGQKERVHVFEKMKSRVHENDDGNRRMEKEGKAE